MQIPIVGNIVKCYESSLEGNNLVIQLRIVVESRIELVKIDIE